MNPRQLTTATISVLKAMLQQSALPGDSINVEFVLLKANGDDVKHDTHFFRMPRGDYGAELLFAFFCLEKARIRSYIPGAKQLTQFYYLEADSVYGLIKNKEILRRWADYLKRIVILQKIICSHPKHLSVSCLDQALHIAVFDADYSTRPDVRLNIPLTHLSDSTNVSEVVKRIVDEIDRVRERSKQRLKRYDELVSFFNSLQPHISVRVKDRDIFVEHDACYRNYANANIDNHDKSEMIGTLVWSRLDAIKDDECQRFKDSLLTHVQHVKLAMPLVKFLSDYPIMTRMVKTPRGYMFYLAGTNGILAVLQPLLQALSSQNETLEFGCAIDVRDISRMAKLDLLDIKQLVDARYERLRCFHRLLGQYQEKFLEKLTSLVAIDSSVEYFISMDMGVYQRIEDELENMAQAEAMLEKFTAERCGLLTECLQDVITDGWEVNDMQLTLATCSARALVTLRCLAIPGLEINAKQQPVLSMSIAALRQLPDDLFTDLRERAQQVHSKVVLLDKIICLSATPVSLERRFREDCFEFICHAGSKLTASIAALIKRDADVCVISYDVCLRDDVTITMLDDCRSQYKPAKVQSSEVRAAPSPALLQSVAVAKPSKKTEKKIKQNKSPVLAKQKVKSAPKPAKVTTTASVPPRIKKVTTHVRELKQPDQRGMMPALDRTYMMADLSKLNADQANMFAAEEAKPSMPNEKRLRITNAHEGALLQESAMLVRDVAVHLQLREIENESKIHYYSVWLAMIRLMNALDLRLQLIPDCRQVTCNDSDAAGLRARLIHDMPTPTCVDKLQFYLLDGQLAQGVKEVIKGKKSSAQIDLRFFGRSYFESSQQTLHEQITHTYEDMRELLTWYDSHPDERVGRAIQACVVKLGELYNSVRFSEIRAQLKPELVRFMFECKQIRDVGSHNNVFNETFDPVSITDVLIVARKGLSY